MLVLTLVTRFGKTNRSGRHVRYGCLPDVNPLLCSWGALGLSLLYRFQVEKESPPDWGDDMYSSLFQKPLLRAPSGLERVMPFDSHSNLIGDFLNLFSVFTSKKTHFFRGNTARNQELESVDPKETEKLMNRSYNLIAQSYGTGLPVRAMLSASGNDPENPRAAGGTHLVAGSQADVDACVAAAAPWLQIESQKVSVAKALLVASINGSS